MNDKFGFKVGPPDDASSAAMMKVGLTAKKNAVNHYKAIAPIVLDLEPSAKPSRVLDFQWQGMIALAAYAITLTNYLFSKMNWTWTIDGKTVPHSKEVLFAQVRELCDLFEQDMDDKEPL